MASVAVILLNYNSTKYTKKCLRSLNGAHSKKHSVNVLVFDNASTKQPKSDEFPNAILCTSKKNLGYAEGNNVAAAHAIKEWNPDFCVFVNNDTRFGPGMLDRLIEVLLSQPSVGIAVPKIYFETGAEFHRQSYSQSQLGKVLWYAGGSLDWQNVYAIHRGVDEVDRGQFDSHQMYSTEFSTEPADVSVRTDVCDFATGCCFAIPTKIWKKLRGFDPKFFLYYEDVDLSVRLKKLGKTIAFVPHATLFHANAGSSHGAGSPLHQYYQTRNRLRFGFLHASFRTKLALLLESRRQFLSATDAVRLGILDALGGRWGNQQHRIPSGKQ